MIVKSLCAATVAATHLHANALVGHMAHQLRLLLHLQIDAPDDQVVGGRLARQMGMVQQEFARVVVLAQHAELLEHLLVVFDKVAHPHLFLLFGEVIVRRLVRLRVDDGLGEGRLADRVHVPRRFLLFGPQLFVLLVQRVLGHLQVLHFGLQLCHLLRIAANVLQLFLHVGQRLFVGRSLVIDFLLQLLLLGHALDAGLMTPPEQRRRIDVWVRVILVVGDLADRMG